MESLSQYGSEIEIKDIRSEAAKRLILRHKTYKEMSDRDSFDEDLWELKQALKSFGISILYVNF